jgi:hypothetical protein
VSCSIITNVCYVFLTVVFLVDAANVKEPKGTMIDTSSGPSTHEKKNRKKRAAKDPESPPMPKKMKITDTHEQVYRKYITHSRKSKVQKKGVLP